MRESLKSRLTRIVFGFMPCYRRTGVKVVFLSADMHEARIKLPLNWKTRGYNGTLFGGSMYACIDPVYMTLLSLLLGRDYLVWDKSATIDFRKPGRAPLFSSFRLDPADVQRIRTELETAERVERTYGVELVDAEGTPYAIFTKTIVVRRRKLA